LYFCNAAFVEPGAPLRDKKPGPGTLASAENSISMPFVAEGDALIDEVRLVPRR